jgi:MOSC domain-containing protein YiiM
MQRDWGRGVYAEVLDDGEIQVGDDVRMEDLETPTKRGAPARPESPRRAAEAATFRASFGRGPGLLQRCDTICRGLP